MKTRLTAHTARRGLFWIDKPTLSIVLDDSLKIELVARNADTLADATKFHFDLSSIPGEVEALELGNKLRDTVHLVTTLFDLELVVHTEDQKSGSLSEEIIQKAKKEGATVLNPWRGLRILPDNESTFEAVFSGAGLVVTNSPQYVLDAMKKVWLADHSIADSDRYVIELLSISTSDVSATAKFLTTYLALEQLLDRPKRGSKSLELIESLKRTVEDSDLPDRDKSSLSSVLGNLNKESFAFVFREHMSRIADPPEVEGIPTNLIATKCIEMRNRIAHKPGNVDPVELRQITKVLRKVIMSIIWTKNRLPNLSLDRPGDTVKIEEFSVRML